MIEEWSSFFAPVTKEDRALRDWFHARSIFLGVNYEKQNVELGIQLASQCTTVPDAVWLCSLFSDGPPKTREEAFTMLQGTSDSRSLGYRAFFLRPYYTAFIAALEAAATLGSIMAQAECLFLERIIINNHKDKWFRDTLQAREPHALLAIAKIKHNDCILLQSARFGMVEGITRYAHLHMDDTNPEKYAALLYCLSKSYLVDYIVFICSECINYKYYHKSVIYRIGSILRCHRALSVVIDNSKQAIQFFNSWTQTVKSSVVGWQLVAKRLGICKDIRLLIAKLIWKDRWNVNSD
jgi:hypothetical protein